MKTRHSQNRSGASRLTVAALLVAGAGILIQILSGAEYPAVPPGLIMLGVSALLIAVGPWRWIPAIATVVALFLIAGLFAAGRATALINPRVAGDTIGLWIQMIAVVVAFISSIRAVRRNYRPAQHAGRP